jgi:hypothetical protein
VQGLRLYGNADPDREPLADIAAALVKSLDH